MRFRSVVVVVASGLYLMAIAGRGLAGEPRGEGGKGDKGGRGSKAGVFLTKVPEYPGNVILFVHQLVGGLDRAGRGGAESASVFEWGGREKDGKDTFAANRSGWEKPVHKLLVEVGVTVVFHGHDHFFARQELDGIVYQLVPQPGQPGNGGARDAANYGYLTGDIRPGSVTFESRCRGRSPSLNVCVPNALATTEDDQRR